MSYSEFYIENGIDPGDPYAMDNWLMMQTEEQRNNGYHYEEEEEENEGGGYYEEDEDDQYYHPRRGHHAAPVVYSGFAEIVETNNNYNNINYYALDDRQLDNLAYQYGYQPLDTTTSSSQAPMASYRKGAVRLNFWLTTGTVGSYLEHPRQGKTQLFRRNIDMREAEAIFRNPRVHSNRGYHHQTTSRRSGGRGPCRFGDRCHRPDCWFDH